MAVSAQPFLFSSFLALQFIGQLQDQRRDLLSFFFGDALIQRIGQRDHHDADHTDDDVTIHSRPKPVKWKTKEIIFCLKANQRLSGRCDLSG